MAVDAGSGLAGTEKVLREGAMRFVAVATILGDRGVFEDPGADFVLVATAAPSAGGARPGDQAPMWLVAIGAPEHAFEDRVMGREPQA